MCAQFQYSQLLQKPGAIRLLQLLPSKDNQEKLRCELFDFNLYESNRAVGPYEALSYVWGGSEKPRSIIIRDQNLAVTENLYAALLRLRKHSFPRIIWIDAICINQSDDTEKESQIPLMAEIYAGASSVIVWLGVEQDDSNRALEEIRLIGEKATANPYKKLSYEQEDRRQEDKRQEDKRQEDKRQKDKRQEDRRRENRRRSSSSSSSSSSSRYEQEYRRRENRRRRSSSSSSSSRYEQEDRRRENRRRENRRRRSSSEQKNRGRTYRRPRDGRLRCGRSRGSRSRSSRSRSSRSRDRRRRNRRGGDSEQEDWREDSSDQEDSDQEDIEQEDGDKGFEEMRVIGEGATAISQKKNSYEAIIQLLRRRWFQRIWVLQEVAAARHVLVICGSMEIDGYAFCLGLKTLDMTIQSTIYPVISLIQRAIFRPRHILGSLGRPSLDKCSLGELVDRYHEYEATNRHDKVYALLGMSSDDLSTAGLEPNYKIPWKMLLQRLIKYLLGNCEIVKTWDDKEMAIVKSRGYVLGRVSSTTTEQNNGGYLHITLQSILENPLYSQISEIKYTLPASTKPVQRGDIICLFQKAVNPSIIRPYKDHFAIIQTTVIYNSTEYGGSHSEWIALQSNGNSWRDFYLVWNWERTSEALNNQELLKGACSEESWNGFKDISSIEKRIYSTALVLEDAKEYQKAAQRLQELVEEHKQLDKIDESRTFKLMKNLGTKYAKDHLGAKIEELQQQILQTKRQLRGEDHQDTLNSLGNLIFLYVSLGYFNGVEKFQVIRELTKSKEHAIRIAENDLIQILRASKGKKPIGILLDHRGDDIEITAKVVEAAASSAYGKEIIKLLFDRRGHDIPITEEVVKAALENQNRLEIIEFLFDRRGDDIPITEEVVKAALENQNRLEIIEFLFDRRGDDIPITEEIVKEAARNRWGAEIISFLIGQRGDDIPITKEVVKAAAQNEYSGKKVMRFLFNQGRDDVQITEEIMKEAARNRYGRRVIELLLDRRGDCIQVTEEVMKAAARNEDSGEEIVKILFDRRGVKIKITEAVLEAAAENERQGDRLLATLLSRRGLETPITEKVLVAAAENERQGDKLLATLLSRRGLETPITEKVLVAAAKNLSQGYRLIAILLNQRGLKIQNTEEIIEGALGNWVCGKEIMEILFDWKGTEIQITDAMIEAALKSSGDAIKVLLDRGGDEIKITEEVLEAAAQSREEGMMRLLLDRKGDEIKITEEVLKAAAQFNNEGMMRLLLDRKGDDIQITEEVIGAALDDLGPRKEMIKLLLDRKGDGTMPSERWLRVWLKSDEERKEMNKQKFIELEDEFEEMFWALRIASEPYRGIL